MRFPNALRDRLDEEQRATPAERPHSVLAAIEHRLTMSGQETLDLYDRVQAVFAAANHPRPTRGGIREPGS